MKIYMFEGYVKYMKRQPCKGNIEHNPLRPFQVNYPKNRLDEDKKSMEHFLVSSLVEVMDHFAIWRCE